MLSLIIIGALIGIALPDEVWGIFYILFRIGIIIATTAMPFVFLSTFWAILIAMPIGTAITIDFLENMGFSPKILFWKS